MIMPWKNFENGFEEERSFVGDTIVLAILFSKKKNHYMPFVL
jgi:hypothetical protein